MYILQMVAQLAGVIVGMPGWRQRPDQRRWPWRGWQLLRRFTTEFVLFIVNFRVSLVEGVGTCGGLDDAEISVGGGKVSFSVGPVLLFNGLTMPVTSCIFVQAYFQ